MNIIKMYFISTKSIVSVYTAITYKFAVLSPALDIIIVFNLQM